MQVTDRGPQGVFASFIAGKDDPLSPDTEPFSLGYKRTCDMDAKTAALAGTTANKLDALGWDGDACIEALPEIVEMLSIYATLTQANDMRAILSRLRPAKGGER